MARLALGGVYRQAGDRRRVAPPRLSLVLDLEKPTPAARACRTTFAR
jgi:hypothetical protein